MTPSLLPTPPAPTLWPHQRVAIDLLDAAVQAGRRAPLLVLPTGSGKTVIAAELIRREVAAGGSVLFLAPRRELIFQTSRKLEAVGVAHGILLAGVDVRDGLEAPVQVGSVDTLVSRALRRGTLMLPDFSTVFVDECHLSITEVRRRLLELWPDALRTGMTATPTRKDGKALGVLYDAIIEPATTADLTRDGYLVPARYWSWPTPDLASVRVTAGDYNQGDLDGVMNRAPLLGDIVEHWLRLAADRRTVVFCTSIAHAVGLAESFRGAGVAAEHVDAGTPHEARRATFERFASGATQVVTNCFLAAYGFDLPALSCVVLARPTKSLMLYLQMLGRGLRIAAVKRECLVLDHAGCVHRHGFATDDRCWTLEGKYALEAPAKRAAAERTAKECPECRAVWIGAPQCPECGYELRHAGRMVRTSDGTLVEITPDHGGPADDDGDGVDPADWYAQLRGYAAEKGYKLTWAAHKYRERHGTFPPWAWNADAIAAPSEKTRRWIKSRLIAWLRAKERAA